MKHNFASAIPSLLLATAFALGITPRAHAAGRKCTNATIQGAFGYTATGTLLPSAVPPPFAGPFGEIGRQTFDGKGNTQATATLSANGNSVKVTITGTYTVNADCTRSMTLNVAPLGAVTNADFVIANNGLQIRSISTDAGTIETRVYTKQFTDNND